MSAIQNKAHVAIDGYVFMLSRAPRTGLHIYGREEAPAFVNKFGAGDPNYRDATFFPHWVQNNWLNGFDQTKFNDGGKFFRSKSLDTTTQESVTLEKNFTLAGSTGTGKIITQQGWRTPASSYFGDGSDGSLTVSVDTTDAPIDAPASGAINSNNLTATNVGFAPGQDILIIQMQGTNAGTYQKNKILSYTAGTITVSTPLNQNYFTNGQNSVSAADHAQVLVLKKYSSITVNSGINWSAKPWDGSVGGILGFMCNGTMTVAGTISATGKGFRGGNVSNGIHEGQSGEGTAGAGTTVYPASIGSNGNGGGGGTVPHGSPSAAGGGGGGGHAIAGTDGTMSAHGAGGIAVGDANLVQMFMGGGGGHGGADQDSASPIGGNGANGGGIIFMLAKTPTVTGSIQANGLPGSPGNGDASAAGGGGAGGSIMIKTQVGIFGASVTNIGSAGGAGTNAGNGGTGSPGRVHMDYLTSATTTSTNPTATLTQDATLSDTPTGSGFTHYVGSSNGKIYVWDGASTYTDVLDARSTEWYATGDDGETILGSVSGAENKTAQSFKIAAGGTLKGVSLLLRRTTGVQGLTVRIETDSAGLPSGSLVSGATVDVVNANIPTTTGWVDFIFPTGVTIAPATTFHIVLQNANFGSETGQFVWRKDGSTPTYTNGQAINKVGAGAWTADATSDMMFRTLANATTQINCSLTSAISGTQKMYFGVGDPVAGANGDARIYSFDGTTWRLEKTFNGGNETAVLSLAEYGTQTNKVYVGLGSTAKIYSSPDFATFTLAKTVTQPNHPGYVFSLIEYNGRLYACGGYPELLFNNNNQNSGFLLSYDEFTWTNIPGFEHTALTTLEVYDNLLFIGTVKKRLYVYNTASIDKLEEFPWNVQVNDMVKFEDKLALALAPTPGSSASGEEAIYIFDRNGFHNAFSITGVSWMSLMVFGNNLMAGGDDGKVYQTNANTFAGTGYVQTSYFEASLPSIDKNWRSLFLHYDALLAGQSFVVDYKTDEANSSWTNVGTINTVGSQLTELTFTSNFYSKKLSLRITFITTDQSAAPKLKVMDLRYVLSPDLKYLWKLRLAAADNLRWLDNTEPIALTTTTIASSDVSLTLNDASGFPSKHRAVIIDNGVEDEFSWTGKTGNTLTGVSGLGNHSNTKLKVVINAGVFHRLLLDLKRTKQFYTFTDIDANTYNILFNNWQESDFVVNQELGIENNVPITLLEA